MVLYKVNFLKGKRVKVESGISLLEAAVLAGVLIDALCGGRGTCKKCKIKIAGKEVLACQTKVNSDLKVCVPKQSKPHITGRIKSGNKINIAKSVSFTQGDIRELQLAEGG